MKKKFYRILKCLVFAVSILQFASCQKDYQKIEGLKLSAGEGKVFVQWFVSSGAPTDLEIDISPLPDSYNALNYPLRINQGSYNYYLFDNLNPEVTYTISLCNYDDKGKQLSYKEGTSKPDVEDLFLEYRENDCQPYVKIPENTAFVKFIGAKGKRVTLANLNPSRENISGNFLRKPIITYKPHEQNSRTASVQRNNAVAAENTIFSTAPAFLSEMTAEEYESKLNTLSRSAAPAYIEPEPYDYKNAKIGDKRFLYLDNDIEFFITNINLVERRSVTLRGIGKKDGKTICFIWVEDSCFTEGECKENKVNAEFAENFADFFTDYYLHETDILGAESNSFEDTGNSFAEKSPTGEVMNIVFYDLAQDYGKNSTVRYNGYFFDRDYYFKQQYSNRGKYIYMDVPASNFKVNEQGADYSGNKDRNGKPIPNGEICSTVFHEFQHLIHFGNKHGKSATWYNEMLSLLTEDMFNKDLVENYNLKKTEGPLGRLGQFLVNNINDWTGVRGDKSVGWDSDVNSSYAKAYFFGAWLVRTYGGMQLMYEMSNSEEYDFTSVINSIKRVTGEDITEEELMRQFMLATVFCDTPKDGKEGFATRHNLPTFNKTCGEPVTSYGHTSSFEPIDLYSLENKWRVIFQDGSVYTLCGPLLNAAYAEYSISIAPRSFVLRNCFDVKEDEELLIVEKQRDPNEELYAFVQDEYEYIIDD